MSDLIELVKEFKRENGIPELTEEERLGLIEDIEESIGEKIEEADDIGPTWLILAKGKPELIEALSADPDCEIFPALFVGKLYGMSAKSMNNLLNSFDIQYKMNGKWFLSEKYENNNYTRIDKKGNMKWTFKGLQFIYNELARRGIVTTDEKMEKRQERLEEIYNELYGTEESN